MVVNLNGGHIVIVYLKTNIDFYFLHLNLPHFI